LHATHFADSKIKLSPALLALEAIHGGEDDAKGTARLEIVEKSHLQEIENSI
jgi:hypothetical protein